MAKAKTDFPLAVHQAAEDVYSAIKGKISKHFNLIIEILDHDSFIVKNIGSEFTLKLDIKLTSQPTKIQFSVIAAPWSKISTKPMSGAYSTIQDVLTKLDSWIDIVNGYNNTGLIPMDPLIKYSHEFYEEYKILDKLADKEPFELERQKALDLGLDQTMLFLQERNEAGELDDSTKEAQSLKNDLGQLTKNQTIQRLGRLFAGIRKTSIAKYRVFEESQAVRIFDWVIKETTDEAINEYIKQLGSSS